MIAECWKIIITFINNDPFLFGKLLYVCKKWYDLRFDFAQACAFNIFHKDLQKISQYKPRMLRIFEFETDNDNTQFIDIINATRSKMLALKYTHPFGRTSNIDNLSGLRYVDTLVLRMYYGSEITKLPSSIRHIKLITLHISGSTRTLREVAPNLESLCLENVDIDPNIAFPKLNSLQIESSCFDIDLSVLSQCTNIRKLRCFRNRMVRFVDHLPSLEILEIDRMDSWQFRCLRNLRNLRELACPSGTFEDLEPVRELKCLEVLTVAFNYELKDISALKNKNLIYLDLTYCPCVVDMSPISTLSKLQTLNIWGVEQIQDIH